MKKVLLLCFFTVLFSTCLLAQSNSWGASFTPSIVTNTRIHFGLQAGLFYLPANSFGYLCEFTLMPDGNRESTVNSKYFRIRPELRYSFPVKKSGNRNYIGLQLSYAFREWKDSNNGFFNKGPVYDSVVSYNSARVNSPVTTVSLQFGKVIPFSKHFSIDLFSGMGVRIINTSYSEIENSITQKNIGRTCKIFPWPDPAYEFNGETYRFHLAMGLRFNYHF